VKEFANRLRFEKVIAKSLVASFFWNTVYIGMLIFKTICSQVVGLFLDRTSPKLKPWFSGTLRVHLCVLVLIIKN